jgi:2-keto-4-pentenoate hydratase
MQASSIEEAAKLLVTARRERRPIKELPPALQPGTFSEAAAIQQATVALLGETVSAYKVAGTTPDGVMWAPILGSTIQASPGRFTASAVPLLGIEAEIAYRLNDDFTAADRGMTLAELEARVTIVPTIEIVDTRFASYEGTPVLHRAADLMSSGGLVHGEPWADAGTQDLTKLPIRLCAGEALICDTVGGHPAKDPRLPTLAFIRASGRPDHLPAGTLITAGSYTGLHRAKPGDTLTARFAGYGEIAVALPA